MRIVRSEKFDAQSNSVLNVAIACANSQKCAEINCSHFMYALLTSIPEIAERFHDDTSVSKDEFFEALSKQAKAGYYGRIEDIADHPNFELTLNYTSPALDRAFNIVLNAAKKKNCYVTIDMLYEVLITDKKNEVYETLNALGIAPETVNVKRESDPLSEMPNTAKFAVDMCKAAKKKYYDPVESREDIIAQIIETLGRRQKGNPILIGDPGVGKTAIIEGLAQQIVEGNVPNYMKDRHIISLDISGVVGGTKFRGEFEERLNTILYEVAAHPNVILFIDEFHMIADAGSTGSEGSMTAANILKPAIAKGDVRIIGATTPKEYHKFIENDGAFSRRLQSIHITEPDVDTAISMIKKLRDIYSEYHNCIISDTVIEAAVKLSDRYIQDKKLPDKAITVIDETAARLKAYAPEGVKPEISVNDIRVTISKETSIDVEDINDSSKTKLQNLEESIKKRIIGQDNAVETVVKAVRRAKAGVKDPNRPIGSFLFVGPTGVGKTELTKALTIELTGNIKNLIRFDMSEFMEKHAVSKLIGAPPGYVGYGEGGQLTEAIKHKPNSVVLFDEIEKAHPDVFNIMLQILEDGILTDSNGATVDFKNCVIIMTSNAGYGRKENVAKIGFGAIKDTAVSEVDASKALEKTFRPEFLNRLDKIVVFESLSKESCTDIVTLELNKVAKRLLEKGIRVSWDNSLTEHILETGYSDKYGARNIKRRIQELVEDHLADKIIDGEIVPNSTVVMRYDAVDKLVSTCDVPVEMLLG